jgi:large subunit ribosomal protein L26e
MKTSTNVSSSRRKNRLAHYLAPSHVRYTIMSANLSKELREKHGIKSLPVRRDDEVLIVRGGFKDTKGKINQCYRRRYCLYIEKVTKMRKNGATVRIPVNASNCVLTKLKLTPDREDLIRRKREGKGEGKGKYTQADVNTSN